MVIIEKVCNKVTFFFFTIRFHKHFKAPKSTKKHQKALKNTANLIFIKLKKHLSEKKKTYLPICEIHRHKIYQFKIHRHKIHQV